MTTYVSIRLLSLAPAVATEALGNWYGGLGNTRLAMIASVVAMLANVFGDYAFIEPRFGLPGYGVAGAAWASVGATLLGFGVVLFAFLKNLGHCLPRAPLGFRLSEFRRVLRFGLPNGINWFLEFAAFVLYINVVVGHMGTAALAAFNVVMQLNGLSFMPAFGVASAGAILVGEAIGARRPDTVWPIVRLTGKVAALWMCAVGVLYLCAPRALIGLFAHGAGAARLFATGVTMLGIAAFWQLFDALSLTLSEALRAAGDTTWCLWARICVAWLLFTPLAWAAVLWLHGGVVTLMLSLAAYVAVLAATLSFRFASGRWRDIDLVGEPLPL